MIEIRALESRDVADCLVVLRALPDWFGIESAIVQYGEELQTLDGFVAIQEGDLIGFVGLKRYGSESVEINVIGVAPDCRGKGIGTALLEVVEGSLSADIKLMHMKTLAPSHPDPNYVETRAFWRARGFVPMDAHELWGKENPCLVMVKPRHQ